MGVPLPCKRCRPAHQPLPASAFPQTASCAPPALACCPAQPPGRPLGQGCEGASFIVLHIPGGAHCSMTVLWRCRTWPLAGNWALGPAGQSQTMPPSGSLHAASSRAHAPTDIFLLRKAVLKELWGQVWDSAQTRYHPFSCREQVHRNHQGPHWPRMPWGRLPHLPRPGALLGQGGALGPPDRSSEATPKAPVMACSTQ